jgi:hypothetical protein
MQGQRMASVTHISLRQRRPAHARSGRWNRLPSWAHKWLIGLALLSSPAAPAAADGTLSCTIDDRNLSLELLAITRIDQGFVVEMRSGSLKLKPGRYAKSAMDFTVTQDNVFLQWSFDRDLRFAMHFDDPDDNQTIVLAILAARDERVEKYLGRYVLQFVGANKTKVLEGKIKSCDGD